MPAVSVITPASEQIPIWESTHIYALCDPDSLEVRYVGKSNKLRLWKHLHDKSITYKTNWIRKLKSNEKVPALKILEQVAKNYWVEAEKGWIKYYRNLCGDRLTNTTEGGDGGFRKGHTVSEETRRKLSLANSGRIQSDEEKIKRIESLKKLDRSEHYKKLSEIFKGRLFSEETRRKISESRKGINNRPGYHHTQETLDKMRATREGHRAEFEARREEKKRIKELNKKPKEKRINTGCLGYKHTAEAREKIAAFHRGKPLSLEIRKKLSEARKIIIKISKERMFNAFSKRHYPSIPRG